jgi:hypothetical protein
MPGWRPEYVSETLAQKQAVDQTERALALVFPGPLHLSMRQYTSEDYWRCQERQAHKEAVSFDVL